MQVHWEKKPVYLPGDEVASTWHHFQNSQPFEQFSLITHQKYPEAVSLPILHSIHSLFLGNELNWLTRGVRKTLKVLPSILWFWPYSSLFLQHTQNVQVWYQNLSKQIVKDTYSKCSIRECPQERDLLFPIPRQGFFVLCSVFSQDSVMSTLWSRMIDSSSLLQDRILYSVIVSALLRNSFTEEILNDLRPKI